MTLLQVDLNYFRGAILMEKEKLHLNQQGIKILNEKGISYSDRVEYRGHNYNEISKGLILISSVLNRDHQH